MLSRTWVAAAGAALALAGGCAPTQSYVTTLGDGVGLQTSDSPHHAFIHVTAYQRGDGVVMRGNVRHMHPQYDDEEHVDVAVMGATGEVLQALSLPLHPRPARMRRVGQNAFHGTLQQLEPRMRVAMAFHGSTRASVPAHDCGDNQALPRTGRAGPR